MSSSSESSKDDKEKININSKNESDVQRRRTGISYPNYYDEFFENFRQNMQNITNVMERSFPSTIFPSIRSMSPFEWMDKITDTRLPLCDVIDRGDKYEINLEVPGLDKERIDVKATRNSLSISGKQSEKTKEKGKNYIYSERSYKSFHRQIPFTQEILPSKISAKIRNGILEIDVPKKIPTKVEGDEEVRIDVN